jgi:nucleoside-diphosphate-sugar epimerase
VLVAGAGGFIGGHLVKRLISMGHEVTGVDIKPIANWYQVHDVINLPNLDLSIKSNAVSVIADNVWVYNLACNMGGMGFIENNKALCMESVLINTHLLQASRDLGIKRYFFSSSACVYAAEYQKSLDFLPLKEVDAYPAEPEDGYGWEKLFSERMCRHFNEDYGLEIRIARYHNVYGPFGTFSGGREKAPAAACRKVAEVVLGKTQSIEIWGDGNQKRSFTYIDDCIDGTIKLMESNFTEPLNIGSSETLTIKKMYESIIAISDSKNEIKFEFNLGAPQGVRGRSSDNTLCKQILNWEPLTPFSDGIAKTYEWIFNQIVGF